MANYEDSYLGTASLWSATATSDNSVFAELGMKVKPRRVAAIAQDMGIRTNLSTNPAMLLGGLKEGVTPLEMAYAYSTLANDGVRVSGSLAPNETGPVAIQSVEQGDGSVTKNEVRKERVFPAKVGQVAKDMLGLVVSSGTGKAAQVGDEFIWGKTGTTENYGDAWFVGGNDDMTVAIWVGYADKLQPMEYEHAGGPVAGGTYPAEIFHDFMSSWIEMREQRRLERAAKRDDDGPTRRHPPSPWRPPTRPRGAGGPHGDRARGRRRRRPAARPGAQRSRAPQQPAPEPDPAPTPAPAAEHAAQRRRRRRRRSGPRRRGLGGARGPHRGRPRPRHVRAVGVAEAPRQLHGLRDADALARPPRAARARPARAPSSSIGPSTSELPFRGSPMPSACVSLPGPEQRSSARARPRRWRISSTPSTGSSARISTAAPTPSPSATAFSSEWIPYEK